MLDLIPENYIPVYGYLVTMLGTFGVIALFLAATDRGGNKALKKFREDEQNANFQRNISLPSELIFNIKTANLKLDNIIFPKHDKYAYDNFETLKNNILIMDNYEFIYPNDALSNLDIKSKYGPITLQTYIKFEQNYNTYIQKLINFSNFLYENELYPDSEKIILELIRLNCISSTPYITLCNIYSLSNQKSKLNKLQYDVENATYFSNNEFARKKILSFFDR